MCKPLQKSNTLNEFLHKYKGKTYTHNSSCTKFHLLILNASWLSTNTCCLLFSFSPDTQTYIDKMKRDEQEHSKGQQGDNRSFFGKYVSNLFLFRVCSPLPFVFVAFVSSVLACKTLSSCCPDSHRKSVKGMREWKNDFLGAQFIAFEVWSLVHRVKLINFLIVFPLLNFQWWSFMWNWC